MSPASQCGTPAFERFNRTFREEVLNLYFFNSLSEVRKITKNWLKGYMSKYIMNDKAIIDSELFLYVFCQYRKSA